jgi:hypothetical protein
MCEDSTSFEFLNVCFIDLFTIDEVNSKIRGGHPKCASFLNVKYGNDYLLFLYYLEGSPSKEKL